MFALLSPLRDPLVYWWAWAVFLMCVCVYIYIYIYIYSAFTRQIYILRDLGGRGRKEETVLHYGKKQGRDLVDLVGKFEFIVEGRRSLIDGG